jgi:hypothetical protein
VKAEEMKRNTLKLIEISNFMNKRSKKQQLATHFGIRFLHLYGEKKMQ